SLVQARRALRCAALAGGSCGLGVRRPPRGLGARRQLRRGGQAAPASTSAGVDPRRQRWGLSGGGTGPVAVAAGARWWGHRSCGGGGQISVSADIPGEPAAMGATTGEARWARPQARRAPASPALVRRPRRRAHVAAPALARRAAAMACLRARGVGRPEVPVRRPRD
ncbi:unnamed protein product, partial [Urochloa humidicola]